MGIEWENKKYKISPDWNTHFDANHCLDHEHEGRFVRDTWNLELWTTLSSSLEISDSSDKSDFIFAISAKFWAIQDFWVRMGFVDSWSVPGLDRCVATCRPVPYTDAEISKHVNTQHTNVRFEHENPTWPKICLGCPQSPYTGMCSNYGFEVTHMTEPKPYSNFQRILAWDVQTRTLGTALHRHKSCVKCRDDTRWSTPNTDFVKRICDRLQLSLKSKLSLLLCCSAKNDKELKLESAMHRAVENVPNGNLLHECPLFWRLSHSRAHSETWSELISEAREKKIWVFWDYIPGK